MEKDLRNGEVLIASREIPITFWIGEAIRCFTIIGIPFALMNVLRVLTNSFDVTNKRVFGKVGLFGTNEYDVALDKINSVMSAQGIFQKILNYGYLVVLDNSGTEFAVLCASPTTLKKQVFSVQDKFKEEQLQNMAKAIKSA
ncbi:PH domain-containing protein [Halobacteriovorax sp. DA5]|uniref:PH domain-containing protein n=1 Tax=Halobacteriovorax sp. DA5 TaxID=2067553 RepID=UPI000CD03752|nr:PH domain-containing protein [Halobacteriovorax sp. DA5]POB13587.1 hypothetical protein C0Z22_10510 [Halobacteriovorax sp. DA5]